MRSPIEIWTRQHREIFSFADQLVELLAPDDIQSLLQAPEETELRKNIIKVLKEFTALIESHFREEEEILLPVLRDNLDPSTPNLEKWVGCLSREHAQMHMFTERVDGILSGIDEKEPFEAQTTSEILRAAYSIQSLVRHHCSKEEREVYSLVGNLPPKAVDKIMHSISQPSDMQLEHLVKPLGNDKFRIMGPDAEGPEN